MASAASFTSVSPARVAYNKPAISAGISWSPPISPAIKSLFLSSIIHDVRIKEITFVGGEGIEPSRPYGHNFLRVERLPIPPLALKTSESILSHLAWFL
ncbi:MAG: hypothetical protein UX00_C0015G0004 [Microgenomates group bacterium GW2011_GWB1_45_17]|nr:MAG: hypothetical protein UX00_C0015G0004 [Microgenomates group bacterium GW2011_GWB1_45_17]KKU24021.1 MAG: hypothetical protein UX36_C0002G0004 [Microgenomates group bacterium GW2011_GWC1_46_15]